MKRKYFHELTKKDYFELAKRGITYKKLAKLHPQPKWCGYPNATEGVMGCWSLTSFMINSENDCKKCDLYYKYETGKSFK
ncbi:MAG TPA: hypothetical protein ENH85_14525 [Candidatus Scalindua sp.]|nr:hypothetical protein [Candidatus Scalindua sp.]